jgi:hypothetical protein
VPEVVSARLSGLRLVPGVTLEFAPNVSFRGPLSLPVECGAGVHQIRTLEAMSEVDPKQTSPQKLGKRRSEEFARNSLGSQTKARAKIIQS